MGGHHNISLATCHWSISSSAKDEGVSHHGNESVNVGSQVNLDEVSIGQDTVRLTEERRVVADDVVNRDAGGEGNT